MKIVRRRWVALLAAVVVAAGISVVGTIRSSALGTSPSISGTVRQYGDGAPLAGWGVTVLKLTTVNFGGPVTGPTPFAFGTTDANGRYTIDVPANGVGYYVCYLQPSAKFPVGQCYLNQPGFFPFPNPLGFEQVPAGATLVKVGIGQHVTGIDDEVWNAAVAPADQVGAISGKVTETLIGAALRGVRVSAFNASGAIVSQALTAADGTYQLDYILPATNYRVCFDGTTGSGGITAHAYVRKCYANVAWSGGAAPIGATHVAVSSGMTTTGINVSLGAF